MKTGKRMRVTFWELEEMGKYMSVLISTENYLWTIKTASLLW